MQSISALSCRVCLQEHSTLININDELEDLHTNLRNLLETCAALQIDDMDVFPKYLCEECTGELLITSKFREKCDISKKVFDEILKNNEPKALEELISIDKDMVEYSSGDELCGNEISDLLIVEENIPPVNEHKLEDEVDKTPFIKDDLHLSLLRKNETNLSNENLITTTEDQLQFGDINDIIVEDETNQFEPHVEHYTEIVDTKYFEKIVAETPSDLSNSISSPKPLVEKLQKSCFVYKCDICGALFQQAFNLQKHLQKSHRTMHYFSCAKCDHWFSKDAEFFKHMENCNYIPKDNNEENRKTKSDKILSRNLEQDSNRKCVYCEKEFPTPFSLRMHIRTHTGERPFECKFCTKSFKTQSQLNVHHKRHTGQADFACPICYKAFYEQSNLSVHMRSHTGERPHVCTMCNKTFSRVFLLQHHMSTHTGERPFSCTYCDKSFRQPTDLRNHLAIHTGQKQHACMICGKSYTKRSHLIQHMLKHNISVEDMESGDIVQEEFSKTTIDNVNGFTQNMEALNSFEEIIERDDIQLQTDN